MGSDEWASPASRVFPQPLGGRGGSRGRSDTTGHLSAPVWAGAPPAAASPSKHRDGSSLSQTLPYPGVYIRPSQTPAGCCLVLISGSLGEARGGLAALGDLLVGEWRRPGPQPFLEPTISLCDAVSLSLCMKASPPSPCHLLPPGVPNLVFASKTHRYPAAKALTFTTLWGREERGLTQ